MRSVLLSPVVHKDIDQFLYWSNIS